MEIKREHHINFWYILGAMIAVMLIQDFLVQRTLTKTIPYSEFEQLVDQGQVSDLVVGQNAITGTLKDAKANEPQRFSTYRVPPELADRLTKAKLTFSGEPPPGIPGHHAWLDPAVRWFPPALDVHGTADDRSGPGRVDGYWQEQGKDLR